VLKKGEDRSLRLKGKPRVAGLTISAEDERGNALEAKAVVDGKELGAVPGTFTVSVCARKVSVRAGESRVERELKLVEGKTSAVNLKLTQLSTQPGESFVEPRSGLRFVAIPVGTFQYQGGRRVAIKAFRLGETPVTVVA